VKNNKVRGKIDKIPIAFADAILVALEITPSNREVKVSKVRALPGFLTKLQEIGVKNCQNVYCTTITAV
jgi:hypothetical protein